MQYALRGELLGSDASVRAVACIDNNTVVIGGEDNMLRVYIDGIPSLICIGKSILLYLSLFL